MSPQLSIVIPTYNRKERLLKLIDSIFNQEHSEDIQIVICDNHSDYDVQSAISEHINTTIHKNLRIIINPINIGMCANLSMLFFHCDTEWMWTMSDDDVIEDGAISTILNDINRFPNVSLLKYSLTQARYNENKECSSLPELIDYYSTNHYSSGMLIFLSNNVYNMKYVFQAYGNTLSNCNCAIGHMLPIFNILDKKIGTIMFMKKSVVSYYNAPENESWNYLNVSLGLSTVLFMPYSLSDYNYRRFISILTGDISHYHILFTCLAIEDRNRGRFLYKGTSIN